MKKRHFLGLALSSPLLTVFKEKPYTLTAGYMWPCGKPRDNMMTLEKLEELSRLMENKRIKPFKLPDGKEYYVWSTHPQKYHRYFI